MPNCKKCAHGVKLLGAYDGITYLECQLEHDLVDGGLTMEQIDVYVKHPYMWCNYKKGKPKNGGVTYDD